MYREINPTKLREARGQRTRKEVAKASNFEVTEMAIYAYEKNKCRPSPKRLAHLLNALGCTFDQVSDPKDLTIGGQ